MKPELERLVRARPFPPEQIELEANGAERAALAERFGVTAIDTLRADLTFTPEGNAIEARGSLTADLVQACAVSGDDFAVRIQEPLALRFVPQARAFDPDEEVELPGEEPDEIEFDGDSFDVGEAVAQSLGLAIDPYAEGPGADEARREAGIAQEGAQEGPLAALLKGLKPG